MSPHVLRRTPLLVPMVLAALAACQDSTSPSRVSSPKPHFAQGDNGVWTVNTLTDPLDSDGICDDVECTIREAIAAAGVDDKIVFANGLQGAIKLTSQLLIPGIALSIDGAGRITLDAQGGSGVLVIAEAQVDLKGLTLTGGESSNGGAIRMSIGRLTISNSAIISNHATGVGGGIFVDEGSVTLTNTTVSGNKSDEEGGAIYNDDRLTITGSAIYGNEARLGGAIFNRGSLAVTGSTISDNKASDAGAIVNINAATATVVRSTISGNLTTGDAGVAGIKNGGSLELRSSTVTRNGGSNNNYGGINMLGGSASVSNSIIAGNTGFLGNDCFGDGIASLGHNLTTTNSCPFAATGDVKVATAQIFTEVIEQALNDNGGPTKTHALIARGRAVDAGYCPGESTDQRGSARPVDDATMPNAIDACDIGAFERQGPPVADLMVSQTVDKTSVKQGELLTYSIRVRNLGPQTAPSVVVTDVLSSGVTFVKARVNKGTITAPPSGETGTVTWSVGDMLNGDNQVADIQVTVLVKGKTTVTNNASVTGNVSDPNKANDSAAITVSVAAGTTAKPRK